MAKIAAQACWGFIKTLEERHIPPEQLVEGLPLSLEQLRDPTTLLSRKVYHQICDRFASLLGSTELPPNPLLQDYLSHSPWQALLDTVPMVLVITDLEGQVVYRNQNAGATYLNLLPGVSVYDVLHESQLADAQTFFAQLKAASQPTKIEWRTRGTEESNRWIETYASLLQHDDAAIGFLFINFDVTERKRYERELNKRAVQLQTLADIIAEIKAVMDISHLIQYVCDLIKDNFGLYHAHIYLLDEAGEYLVVEGGSGEVGKRIVESRRSFSLDPNQRGVVATAARERRICLVNRATDNPLFLFNPFLPDTKSEMAIPVMLGDHLMGVLDVQSDRYDFFTQEDEWVQQTLADQIAIAIQNAELYENILQQWEITNTFRDIGLALTSSQDLHDILQNILTELQRILPYSAAAIWLHNEEGKLRLKASHGFEQFNMTETFIQQVVDVRPLNTFDRLQETNRPWIISDTWKDENWTIMPDFNWVRSWVAAPIRGRDALIGVITLDHTTPNYFQKQHESILDTVVRQVALVVENTYLFEAERSQREIAETLSDIGLVLSSQLDKATILQLVLAQVARVLPYDAAAVWLDDGQGIFKPEVFFGYERFNAEAQLARLSFRFDELYVNQTMIISDTHQDARWRIVPNFEWVRSWAAAPIMSGERIIGQLVLDHTQPNFYTTKYKPLLGSLANQISLAVGNAQLFEAERRRRQEIELLQRGNLSLTSSLELPVVLSAILNATLELVPVHTAGIFLYEDEKLQFWGGHSAGAPLTPEVANPSPDGLTYRAAKSGESIILDNIHESPYAAELAHQWFKEFEAMMFIPLKFGERVVGVMTLTFRTAVEMHRVEISSLHLLANQASIAIENARLFKAVQDYATLLETRVQERTAELEQERAQLQAILDGMGEGVIYDEAFEVKYVNKVLSRITGYRFNDLTTFQEVLRRIIAPSVDADAFTQQLKDHVPTQGVWRGEVLMQRSDQTLFIASIYATALYNSTGDLTGVVTIIRDISQEKALQEQKDRFISYASHELRTPITNIQTRLYLIRKRPEDYQKHLAVVEDVTTHMAALVKDLLDLSRFERGLIPMNRQSVVVQDLIRQVVNIQSTEAQRKDIFLNLTLPEDPIIALIDPQRITQALTNLISNAISYTPEQGVVRIQVLPAQAGNVAIQVVDSGIGIAPHFIKQVFQPFFRVQEGVGVGAGLGLSITKEIVEAHQGHLEVTSEELKGSIFTITLPLSQT